MENTIDRAALLTALNRTKPAISTQAFIPILNHFLFDGESVTSYNDISAISVLCEVEMHGCLPADLLIKTLQSMTTETVCFKCFEEQTIITAGKSKVKLPTRHEKDFPISFKELLGEPLAIFMAREQMLGGLKKCLLSVGTDTGHPEHMGVTIVPRYSDTQAALYSSDNITLSKYIFESDSNYHDPIFLPTFFCNQLLALANTSDGVKIEIHPGALIAVFSDGTLLFTKSPNDTEPSDFEKVIGRFVNYENLSFHEIPDLFDSSFERAILVQANEMPRRTRMTLDADTLTLASYSKSGEAFDEMQFRGEYIKFNIDPMFVKRVLPITSQISLLPRVVALSDADQNFLHLIAHQTSPD